MSLVCNMDLVYVVFIVGDDLYLCQGGHVFASLLAELWLACLKDTLLCLSVSTIVYCPSCSHISKTKQDKPIVTMEHYTDVGTGDSVAAF